MASTAAARAKRLPAKLAHRQMAGVIDRQRLYERLDDEAARGLIWVQGPAGCGKSTLLSSYLDARALPGLWYRADEGDADPATCFAYLAEAAAACIGAHKGRLPACTPDVMSDLRGFTRRFVRLLFEVLPERCVLVFDELENAAGDTLHELLRVAVAELPQGMRLIVTSRNTAPPTLAHLVTKGPMFTLGWDDLRLTEDEARAIAERRAADVGHALPLHQVCDGWVAGYVVLLEALRRQGPGGLDIPVELREHLFPYFVNELFARAEPATRAMLTHTAVLPSFTVAQAAALTPGVDAQGLIDALYARHFFIERSAGDPPVYRYHALFRGFLLQQLPSREATDVRVRAAALLQSAGRPEEALALLIEGEAWPLAAAAVCELAPALLAQGRCATLERHLDSLPAPIVDSRPWLPYWRGMARMPTSPLEARTALEAAYAAFERQGDRSGCLLACSSVLESTLHQWSDLHHVDRWGDALRRLLATPGPALSAEVEARALSSVSVLMMRGPDHVDLMRRSLQYALAMIPTIVLPAPRLGSACLASLLLSFTGDWAAARRLVQEVDAWLDPAEVPPLQLAMWHWLATRHLLWGGDPLTAAARFATASSVRSEHHLRVMDVVIEGLGVFLAMHADDVATAEQHAERMRAALRPARRLDAANADMQAAMVALARGRYADAATLARGSIEKTEACGSHMLAAQCRFVLALVLALEGDLEGAAATAEQVLANARAGDHRALEHGIRLVTAWLAVRAGRGAEALQTLREALALGRRHGFRVPFPWVPQELLQTLLPIALRARIEPDLVREMIRLRSLPAPAHAPLEWPWPIRVRCFGRFAVWIGDAPLQSSAKAPKKPLELLKALIALGGEAVPLPLLEQHLWPDLDGDAAHNSFNVAVHRLRRLLGDERALVLREGRLSIDPQRLWTDVHTLAQLEARLDDLAPAEAARELLELYTGPFLDDDDAPWAQAARARLRSHLLRTGALLGGHLERIGELERAAELRLRIAELDRRPGEPGL